MSAAATPHPLLTQIVTPMPNADDVAASIPVDCPNVDVLLHSLTELKRLEISEKWLAHVARRRQHDLEIIDTLYDLDPPLAELVDIKNSMGRVDEKAAVWLIRCDVDIQHNAWDTVLECLHRLDGSGLLATTGRLEITKRLQEISEQRTYESKMPAVHALEISRGEQPKKP